MCVCPPGFTGDSCETKIYPCDDRSTNQCFDFGTKNCEDVPPVSYNCVCNEGYTGKYCDTIINFCESMPCHGHSCVPSLSRFECICPQSKTGKFCETSVDYCKDIECQNNGVCVSLEESYACRCGEQFYGRLCQYEKQPCDSSPCSAFSLCKNLRGINGKRVFRYLKIGHSFSRPKFCADFESDVHFFRRS